MLQKKDTNYSSWPVSKEPDWAHSHIFHRSQKKNWCCRVTTQLQPMLSVAYFASDASYSVPKESAWLAAWSCKNHFRSQAHKSHVSARTGSLFRFCEHAQWKVQRSFLKAVLGRKTKRLKIPARGWLNTGLRDESLTRFSTKFLWEKEQVLVKSSPF